MSEIAEVGIKEACGDTHFCAYLEVRTDGTMQEEKSLLKENSQDADVGFIYFKELSLGIW